VLALAGAPLVGELEVCVVDADPPHALTAAASPMAATEAARTEPFIRSPVIVGHRADR
jgi:hypothetical protein